MFGRDWQPGKATIVTRRGLSDRPVVDMFEYVADVVTDDGQTRFRAKIEPPRITTPTFRWPREGETVPVEIDAKHQKARFNKSDPMLHQPTQREINAAEKAAFDEVLAAAPPAGPGGTPSDEQILEAWRAMVTHGNNPVEPGVSTPLEVQEWLSKKHALDGNYKSLSAMRPEWKPPEDEARAASEVARQLLAKRFPIA